MGASLTSFPLFPLGLVLLPGEIVPLHIFEERYKLMIGECLDQESEFGIVWLGDEELKNTGCAARVSELLEQLDDGRMNVLVEGTTPFVLERRIQDLPYPAGDVQLLDEDGAEIDDETSGEARSRYADIVERVTESRPSDDDLSELDAYGMAATLDIALDAKQQLLESRSEQERLEHLAELFESALGQLDHAELAAARAQSNGKIHFGSR